MTAEVPEPPPQAPKRPRRLGRVVRVALLVLTFLLLAASIAANMLLVGEATRDYRRISDTRLDPYGLKHPDFPPDRSAPASSTSPGAGSAALPVVLFFGDSRAKQWPFPAVAGYRFVNRGIGDQTTEQVRGRFDAHVAPLSPRVVLVEAGINDLKAIPLLPYRREEIVADCKANLRQIVRRARDGGAVVIVSTIFPPGKVPLERRTVWSPEVEKAVEEVNAEIRGWAGEGVFVLDGWKLLEDHGKLRDGYGVDTLHLSARGYEVLNAELTKLLEAARAR